MILLYTNINEYAKYNDMDFINSVKCQEIDKYKKLDNKHKRQFLVSRLLLNRWIDYKNMNVYYSKRGKPLIDGIYFSISHSFDYVAVGYDKHNNIGIDIEKIRDIDLNVIDYFCSKEEKDIILKSKNIYKMLFTYYVLKEAYIKMMDIDISNIKDICFDKDFNCVSDSTVSSEIIFDDDYVIGIIKKKD